VVNELALLRRSVEDMRKEQRRLEAKLQARFNFVRLIPQTRMRVPASMRSGPNAGQHPHEHG
jgi:hypothetical protein